MADKVVMHGDEAGDEAEGEDGDEAGEWEWEVKRSKPTVRDRREMCSKWSLILWTSRWINFLWEWKDEY